MQNYTYAALLYFDEAQNVKKRYLYITYFTNKNGKMLHELQLLIILIYISPRL